MNYTLSDIIRLKSELDELKTQYEKTVQTENECQQIYDQCKNVRRMAEKAKQDLDKEKEYTAKAQLIISNITSLNEKVEITHKTWYERVLPHFQKATLAGIRIDFFSNGYMISDNSPSGIYIHRSLLESTPYSTEPIEILKKTKCETKIVRDLSQRAKIIYNNWKAYDNALGDFWAFVKQQIKKGWLRELNGQEINDTYTKGLKRWFDEDQQDILRNKIKEFEKHDWKKYGDVDSKLKLAKESVIRLEKDCNLKNEEIKRANISLAENDPIEANYSIPNSFKTNVYEQRWLDLVKKAAVERIKLPYIASGNSYLNFENEPCLWINPTNGNKMENLKQLVTTLLLAFSIRKVHISIVERETVPLMLHEFNNAVCDVIDGNNYEQLNNLKSRLRERYRELEKTTTPNIPSEVVVLAGYTNRKFEDLMSDLKHLVQHGKERGVIFIVVPDDDYDFTKDHLYAFFNKQAFEEQKGLLKRPAVIMEMDEDSQPGEKKMKSRHTNLEELVKHYVNMATMTIDNKVYTGISEGTLYKRKPITDTFTEQPVSNANALVIPFAESTDGREMSLRFATVDHFSTFVIGSSGSGKSYLLHNILSNMMLKYDPSVVDLILMDFKEGGVELDYYKDVPHVSKLLVNGSDKQIVYEIMNNIDAEMRHRGEILNECKEKDIDGYNKYAREHQLPQMKHVVLLVDECHRLFESDSTSIGIHIRERIQEIVANIARQGRSQGVNLVFATQLYHHSGIPIEAIKQFSDFLLMNCTSDDVADCGIEDRDVKGRVSKLLKGQVIHFSKGVFQQGFVYDYAGGKQEIYKKQTSEKLHDKTRYTQPNVPQFYFNACQRYYISQSDLHIIDRRSSRIPVAMLGRGLTVKGEPILSKFKKENGSNLLIMGINSKLQAERVLWGSVMSLWYSHKKTNRPIKINILNTFPEEEDEIQPLADQRHTLVKHINNLSDVKIWEEDERSEAIAHVSEIVRKRMNDEETEESIYLILPNQELFCRALLGRPKGGKVIASPLQDIDSQINKLGFNSPNAPAFATINTGQKAMTSSSYSSTPSTLQEELLFILNNGPEVRVHVIIQATSPDKIFPTERLTSTMMDRMFHDIVMLRMGGIATTNLPIGVEAKHVDKLSDNLKSLRAIVFNSDDGIRTFVPYDFPGGEDDTSNQNIFDFIK